MNKWLIAFGVTVCLLLLVLVTTFFFDPKSADRLGRDLEYAAQRGDLDEVKSLLGRGAPINYRLKQNFDWTPLVAATFAQQTNVIQFLIRAGADVNVPDNHGQTAIMWLTFWKDGATPYAKALVDHGANLKLTNDMGLTVLQFAEPLSGPRDPKLTDFIRTACLQQQLRGNSNGAAR